MKEEKGLTKTKNRSPKISVIVPVRDLSGTIEECLDSIAAQDFDKSDYEILVVFDSCTDDSEAVVSQWSIRNTDVRIRTFSCNRKSPGGARNVGLDNASGKYVMFVDGDDRLIDDRAMTILCAAVRGHNAVRVTDHEVGGSSLKFSERLTIWLHFFSKALIGGDRFSELLLCEDYEFVKRIRSKPEYDEALVSTPLYYYNYDAERMKARIKNVVSESRERAKQGLPPLYVSDGFIPEGAKPGLRKISERAEAAFKKK